MESGTSRKTLWALILGGVILIIVVVFLRFGGALVELVTGPSYPPPVVKTVWHIDPSGPTNRNRPDVTASVERDDGNQSEAGIMPDLDPSTIVLKLDGRVVPHHLRDYGDEAHYLPPEPLSQGRHTVEVFSKTRKGKDNDVGKGTFTITFIKPTARITSRIPRVLSGNLKVFGTALCPIPVSYELTLQNGAYCVRPLGTGRGNTQNGLLGSLDTRTVPNGHYVLVLSVRNAAGSVREVRVPVNVKNQPTRQGDFSNDERR